MNISGIFKAFVSILLVVFTASVFAGCLGGGGGGGASAPLGPGTVVSGVSSIVLEGDVDASDMVSPGAAGAARAFADDVSRFIVAAVDNSKYKAYMSGKNPAASGTDDLEGLVSSGAIISSKGLLSRSGPSLIYTCEIPVTNESRDSTIMVFDRYLSCMVFSCPLGAIPGRGQFSSAMAAADVSLTNAPSSGIKISVSGLKINALSTARSVLAMENDLCGNVGVVDPAVVARSMPSGTLEILTIPADSGKCNLNAINNLILNASSATVKLSELEKAIRLVNSVIISADIADTVKKSVISAKSGDGSGFSPVLSLISNFVKCIKNDTVVNKVKNAPIAVVIGGTTIDSRFRTTMFSDVISSVRVAPSDQTAEIVSARVVPASAGPGEIVSLFFSAGSELASEPLVRIFGREASVRKLSGKEFAVRIEVAPGDAAFTFSIDGVVGLNGRTGRSVSATTDGSGVVLTGRAPAVFAPAADPPPGGYAGTISVTLATKTEGAWIRFTTDGGDPSGAASKLYSEPITVDSSLTIRSVATLGGVTSSMTGSAYKITAAVQAVADPAPGLPGGYYDRPQAVDIACATPGASVRYTIDGSIPSASIGFSYSSALNISSKTILKAIAYKEGMTPSRVVTAIYDIGGENLAAAARPVITPASGKYLPPQAVSISCATPGAAIRYTLDGKTPTFSSGMVYSSSFILSKSATVKAAAFKNGMSDSETAVSSIEITDEVTAVPPISGIAEVEPFRNGSMVNSNFDVAILAPAGTALSAQCDGAQILRGASPVISSGPITMLAVDSSKLTEGITSEILISGVSPEGLQIGELRVFVKKDTIPPRVEKLSAASSNRSGTSFAAIGDHVVITLVASESVKNMTASMMSKPVTIRSSDPRNWTVSRYLDGTENISSGFSFMINFTDLAGNPVSYTLTEMDINDGPPLAVDTSGSGRALQVYRKKGINRLFLSTVPVEMEYSLDGSSTTIPGSWLSGKGQEIDLSVVGHGGYVFIRQRGGRSPAVCIGKFLRPPSYGIGAAKEDNGWALDASAGALVLTSLNDGVSDVRESDFLIHVYSGSSADGGEPVHDAAVESIPGGSTARISIPPFAERSWKNPEFVNFYLESNGGTPEFTADDVYVQPAAGAAVRPAPQNSPGASPGNFIYDGRFNRLVFAASEDLSGRASPEASTGGSQASVLKPISPAQPYVFELPFQARPGDVISVSMVYNDGSVGAPAKVVCASAPQNLSSGYGNFSVKAVLGQVSVTNFDAARDGYSAFASSDGGANWTELGRINSSVGQNFNFPVAGGGGVKVVIRDLKGNFSLSQPSGAVPPAAPRNAPSGPGTFRILGSDLMAEFSNPEGALNGHNLLYSINGSSEWSSTPAASIPAPFSKFSLPAGLKPGDRIRVAYLDETTGNASPASDEYLLAAASNRKTGAVDGDYILKANERTVEVFNKGLGVNGLFVHINGAIAGQVTAASQSFSYSPVASGDISLHYSDAKGNTWIKSKAARRPIPANTRFEGTGFYVDAAAGRIVFKNDSGIFSGMIPIVSIDGGASWKSLGTPLSPGESSFDLPLARGAVVAAALMDTEGNAGASSALYEASSPVVNPPIKLVLAGDGGAGAKAGVIEESGKPAVTIRPGVTLKNGESLKVTLYNGGAVSMIARARVDGVIPVFGGSTPGVIYEAGAAGNGNAATGSFNLNNPGGTPVSIIGSIEVAAVYSDIPGNISPVSKAYITADTVPPVWAAGYPAVSAPAYFKLKAGVQINEDGKIYLVCLKSAEASPTAAQVKAGLNASGAAVAAGMKAALDFTLAGGAVTHEFAGLDNNAEYALYAVAEDLYENLQAQPAVVKMKTLNNVAPIWAAGYPKADAPAFNQLSAAVKMNETGSVYLVCLKSGAAALSAAQVKAGTDASGAALNAAMKAVLAMTAAGSEAVHIFAGLENAVEYDIYAVAEDEYGELQANPTVTKIKTIDDLPPVWASGYPQGQPTGYTSLRVNFIADKKASIYAICLTSGSAEPSPAQVIGGRNASDIELASNLRGTVEIAANTAGYINFTNLGIGTPYDIYSAAVNGYGVAQTAVTKTRVNTIAFTPPSFQVQYYSDANMLTEIADTPILKAGTYYLKIVSNVSLNAAPKVFITTEAAVNDISDAAATHVESNKIYKLTRIITQDNAAVGAVQENIEISATSAEGISVTKLKPSNLSTKGAFIDTVAPAGTVVYTKSGGFYENTDFTPARQYVKNGDNFTATFTYTEGIKAGVTPKFKIAKPDTTQVIYADMTPNGDRTVWTYAVTNLAATAGEEFLPTVTIEGAVDKAGNAASYTFTKPLYIDNKGPVFTPVTIASNNANPIRAKTGDVVTLSFTAGEKLNAAPVVKFKANGANERTATIGGPTVLAYTATYTMQNTDEDGAITFTLNGADMVGNAAAQVTAVTSGSGVTFDKTISVPTLTSPAQNSPVFADFAITVATEASATVTAKIGVTNVLKTGTSATANGAGSATFTVNIAALTAGAVNAIDIVATDPAGNVSSGLTANMDKGYVLSGTITDSTSQVVPNVTVSVKNGATVLNSTTSASNGTYSLIAGRTTYDMEYARDGYVTKTDSINMSGGNQTNSPTLSFAPGTFRIVMEWTAVVDLDSYTRVPAGGLASIDFDNTAGGPGAKETTTVLSTSADGNYHFSVLKYSAGSGTVRGRGATVKVFDNTGQIGVTMSCPAPLGGDPATDSWWDVATINKNGTTITIPNVYGTTTTSQPVH